MSHIEHTPIDEFAKSAYLAYAMKVVKDRAIPDVEDGIKPVQRRILYAMQQLKLLPVNAKPMKCARVVGDCFVAGTLVHTAEGLKAIEDMKVDEFVRMPNGKTSKVVQIFQNPPSVNVCVKTKSGHSTTVTPGQLFRVISDNLEIQWARADELAGRTVLLSSAAALGFPEAHPNRETVRAAYAAGLLVAEGYLSDRGRSRRVGVRMVDKEPLDMVAQACLERGVRPRWGMRKQRNSRYLDQYEIRFSGWDEAYEVCQNTCQDKRVPAWVIEDRRLFAPFLAGFFDGDGFVRKNSLKREVVLTTTSNVLSNQLTAMLADAGIHCARMDIDVSRRPKSNLDLIQLVITGDNASVFANWTCEFVCSRDKRSKIEALANHAGRHLNTSSSCIPAAAIWNELSSRHLGAGWYLDKEGRKFRSGIRYPGGSKVRYHSKRGEGYLSYRQLKSLGILEKLDRIGSQLATRIEELMATYSTAQIASTDFVEVSPTFDVQIADETHEFLCNGFAVHNCIGKYHPHGDSAVYEAMVRMSQPFSLRYPLVHGEGNFGSRDGDSPAAMRYTEARLAPIAAALLDELAWDTVDFKPTYDNTQEEPQTLPSRLPFLLLNGSYGIAVGMATNLLPHNLIETVDAAKLIISKPKATFDEVMELLQGPDFPTGGQLISSKDEIKAAYAEGRGTLRLRSKWTVEPVGKSWRLLVNELPQDTSTAKVMMQIDELLDPKPAEKNGKKLPLKPEQLRLKKMFGDMIENYVDGSDKDHPVRLVIDPKDRKLDPQVLAMALCAHTEMEMNVSPNFVCVDMNGTPRQGGIIDWLRQWCDYRIITVRRRLTDEKARVDRRLHLLAGRLSILDRIEEVIRVLKKSENPKQDLMDKFGLDDIQAEDVLEMRLRQLANLEKTKILDEQAKLLTEQGRLAKLLGDEKLLRKSIIKELEADAKAFGDDRRTELAPAEATNSKKQAETMVSERLSPEPVAIVLTERGWLGWRPAKTMEEALTSDFKVKSGDQIRRTWVGDRNSDHAVFMDETGRAYSLKLTDLPSKADMLPLTTWFEPQAKITEGAVGSNSSQWVVFGSGGYGFVVKGSDWINRMRAGKAFLSIGEGECPLPPIAIPEKTDPQTPIIVLATDGRAVSFPLSDIKQLPKGKGVGLIGLAGEHMVADAALVQEGLALRNKKGNKVALPADLSSWLGTRSAGKKGKALHKQSEGAIFIRPGREKEES